MKKAILGFAAVGAGQFGGRGEAVGGLDRLRRRMRI